MTGYRQMIHDATKAPVNELSVIEEIMREDVLHSTLDHLSAAEFRAAAKIAYRVLQQERAFYERYYPQLTRKGD